MIELPMPQFMSNDSNHFLLILALQKANIPLVNDKSRKINASRKY
jgi:hypothetical protein